MSSLEFTVEDNSQVIDTTKLKAGALVTCQVCKDVAFYSNPLSYALVGYIDYPSPDRPQTSELFYQVRVIEAKKGMYDSQMEFRRSAPIVSIDNPNNSRSREFMTRVHLADLVSKKKYTILNDQSVKDRWGYTLDISTNLSIIIPKLNYIDQSAGVIYDDIVDLVSAVWGMKYDGGAKIIWADYPSNTLQKVIIKSSDQKSPNDDPAKTSYIVSGFGLPSSSSQTANFASRIFARTKIDKKSVANGGTNRASTLLTSLAIAQPFTTNETRFNGISFIASKVGNPESPKDRINGAIFLDNGGKPEGPRIASFNVPLDEINSDPTTIFVDIEEKRTRFLTGINYWLVWYQRSGTTGDPNNDVNNAIRIHRDINTDGGSLTAQGGDRADHENHKLVWKTHGPTYVFNVYSTLNRLFAVTNYSAVADVGLIEPPPLDISEIDDVNLANRYTGNILYLSSLFSADVDMIVTNPDSYVFRPNTQVMIFDTLAAPNGIKFFINSVEYDFTQNNNEVRLTGTTFLDYGFPASWPCTAL